MAETETPNATTFAERSKYWADVGKEAWELSRERLQWHHEAAVGLLALGFVWYFRGLKEAVEDLKTSLLFVAAPVAAYMLIIYVANLTRAFVRVPVQRGRTIDDLNAEIDRLKNQRLGFDFSDSLIDSPNSNLQKVGVKVANGRATTIADVSVRIDLLEKADESEDTDVARGSKALHGLPLMLRGDYDKPPRRAIDLHAGDEVIFDVVTMQQHFLETVIWHTAWHHVQANSPSGGIWSQRLSGAVPPGKYRIRLRAQGRDVQAEVLTLEFENISGRMLVRQLS